MRPRRPSARSAWVVAAALAASLAACAQPGPALPTATGSDTVALQSFYSQQITWGPCAAYASTDDDRADYSSSNVQCGRLEVPLDYTRPEGRTAQIAVLRQKAIGQKIGSLVFNPGGPGASGVSEVAHIAANAVKGKLSQRFDLVGFDPRGVGASTPALECLDDADWAVQRARTDDDPSPAGVARTEQENRDYAAKCAQRSGGADVLANVGTRDVAKDLDILRAALGDAKLSYLGYSYGTRIGSTYAEEFPQNVRAMVLDGALDPTQTTVDRDVAQNAGFQQAFDAFAADCAKQPACPLGPDPTQATATYQKLTRPLLDNPLAVGNRMLSYQDAITATILTLYSPSYWPFLRSGLTGLVAGDGSGLLMGADMYDSRGADGVYANNAAAFIAIGCVDEQRITDPAQEADMLRRSMAAAPFEDTGRGVVAALEPCAFWPAPPTAAPHVPNVQGLPPILVVSTTGDPATPYQAGVDLAKGLRGSLVTYDGTQHTIALQGNACVDTAVTSYLIDLTTPAADPHCPH